MKISIKARLYFLALVPLLMVAIATLYLTYAEIQGINQIHSDNSRLSTTQSRERELKSYMDIVHSSLNDFRNQDRSLAEVVDWLSQIQFGQDGYVFGYTSEGTRVLLGASDKGLGNNYLNLKDVNGFALVRDIIEKAKNGGGYTTYYFPRPGEQEAAAKLAYSIYEPKWDLIIGTGFYIDDIEKNIALMKTASDQHAKDALFSVVFGTAVVILLAVIFTVLINRSILGPLSALGTSLSSFANGDADLTKRLLASNVPELNNLCVSFNHFLDTLHHLIKNVRQVSTDVTEESHSMTERSSKVKHLAGEQREETEQVSTAITEMTVTAKEISNNALQAADAANAAEQSSNETASIVGNAVNSVNHLANNVQNAVDVIAQLEGDVNNISGSLSVIQDIAEQTNLLALNAAIEAARAGDQGRGFAVVADEVRQLATRTQNSTQDIQARINQLKSASDAAVEIMRLSHESGLSTVEEAKAASESIDNVLNAIRTIMDMNALIATATEQQSQVGEEISQRIELIFDKSHQASSVANENAQSSVSLNQKSADLAHLVNAFTL